MSTLQISLAVAGGLILTGVVAHSAWSSRRNAPKQPTPAEDATQPMPLPESTVADGGDTVPASNPYPGERQEPSFDTGPDTAPGEASFFTELQRAPMDSKPALDPLIDVIAPVAVDNVVSGEAALAAMPTTRRAGSKPFGVEGLSATTGEWQFPVAGQRYSAFQCAVQLANRTGALNQIEYSEFVMKTQAFADALGGEAEFPDMLEEVARARELDQFASGHDAQLSFTLRAVSTAWSPGYVQQCAGRIGFIPGALPGRMVLPASGSGQAPVLGLSFDAQAAMAEAPEDTALREVRLSLDVPQVPHSELPFTRLCESAIALAKGMGGVIIDDNGAPIRPEAMEAINTDLEALYTTLEGRDLAAGSALARRLFS
ncbi:MAG: cell division protein FtsZ [Polaromonas sp.]